MTFQTYVKAKNSKIFQKFLDKETSALVQTAFVFYTKKFL